MGQGRSGGGLVDELGGNGLEEGDHRDEDSAEGDLLGDGHVAFFGVVGIEGGLWHGWVVNACRAA